MRFKVWIDPATVVNKMDVVLNNPWIKLTFDLTGVEKGKWV